MLDELLEYHETPTNDDFAEQVMKRVRRQQRLRRAILWGTGLVGAAFGAAGVMILSEPLSRVFESYGVLPVCVGVVSVAGFMAWLFQDEAATTG